MPTDETQSFLVDLSICRNRCPRHDYSYSCNIRKGSRPGFPRPNQESNVLVSGTDFCSLLQCNLNSQTEASPKCLFYVEHVIVGGTNQFPVRSLPVGTLMGKTIIFKRAETEKGHAAHWQGVVLRIVPQGLILDRHDIDGQGGLRNRVQTIIRPDVLTNLWPLFRVKEPDKDPELVRLVE